MSACTACLRRTWLLSALAGHLETERARIGELLRLEDARLIAAVGGARRPQLEAAHERFGEPQAELARARIDASAMEAICRCQRGYPESLRDLAAPPAVLHIGGAMRSADLMDRPHVALVGARGASAYGTAVAHSLGAALAASGVTVISGMAPGIDGESHLGALSAHGLTVAVMPGGADRPYPASAAPLHRQLARAGALVSELPPGTAVRRWMFAARNRVIAALAEVTVVIEASERSGSLLTAGLCAELGRRLAAVPGPVTSRLSQGPNRLILEGAALVRGAADVLDLLYGVGQRPAPADGRPALSAVQQQLLDAVAGGLDSAAALCARGIGGSRCLAELAALELGGRIRRAAGGRLVVIP